MAGFNRVWPGMTEEDEYAKIEAAGGKVIRWDGHHVFGALAMSRSIVASESAFSTSGRVLSIRRIRLTPTSLEMCMCLKDHLDAKEHIEEDVFDDEVQQNEAIPLSDEEIALNANASSEGTLSPGGPRYDYMMSREAEDGY
nr:abscisic acid insensitivity 1B [Tanacetum cinerariifolium]